MSEIYIPETFSEEEFMAVATIVFARWIVGNEYTPEGFTEADREDLRQKLEAFDQRMKIREEERDLENHLLYMARGE